MRDWLTSTRVAIVAGKGGVGSSTVAAASALAAAQDGADVLFIAVDGRPGMGPLLGGDELGDRDRRCRRLDGGGGCGPDDPGRAGVQRLPRAERCRRAAAPGGDGGLAPDDRGGDPGLEHLLVLGMIKQLEKERPPT